MKKVLYLFVVLLFISGSVFAQNVQELRIGSTLSGHLDPGGELIYSVRTARAGVLVVETTGSTDTYLEVYDDEDRYITSDDDGGEGFNAKIEIVVQANRTYFFYLYGYDDDDSGPFRISATHRNFPNTTEMRLGSSLNLNMTRGQEFWYRVRSANAGFIIVQTTGDIDTYLEIYDELYNLIDRDDDSGEGFNALIEIFAEANKTYIIRLRGYDGEVSGRTSISAAFEAIPPDQGNISRERAAPLTTGEVQTVFFRSDSETRWFVYEVTRAVTLTVQTRGNIDTVMYLYDRNGNLIAEDDDSGEDYNARISQRLNPGTYFIEIKEYWGELGRFTLHTEIR